MAHIRETAHVTVLRNQSIWAHVFANLAPESPDMDEVDASPIRNTPQWENRLALACAARTCRAFSSPALDVLWREIEELSALLKLFPSYMQHSESSVWVGLLMVLMSAFTLTWLWSRSYTASLLTTSGHGLDRTPGECVD